jgi:hypothetical protein
MIDLHCISHETFDDGIGYEVERRAVFERKYQHLNWPKERRGRPAPSAMISARRPRHRSGRIGATRSTPRP